MERRRTTSLRASIGMACPSRVRITLEGRDLQGVPPHGLAGLGIAWVPEERRIFRLLTVLENLRTGLDRPGIAPARREQLLEKVYSYFPILRERRSQAGGDRKSTRLNSSHANISYAVFCL